MLKSIGAPLALGLALSVSFHAQGQATPPSVRVAIWAQGGTTSPGLEWSGSDNEARGLVHTNGSLKVAGSKNAFHAAVTYVGTQQVSGSSNTFASGPTQVAARSLPYAIDLASYAPGGTVQQTLGAKYHDKTSACQGGKWQVSGSQLPLADGVYYVPCEVHISGSNVGGRATIVTTSTIQISGSQVQFTPYDRGLQFATPSSANDAIKLSGSRLQIGGLMWAPNAALQISGSEGNFACGIVAGSVKLSGAKNKVAVGACGSVPDARDSSVTTAEDTPVAIALAATDADREVLTYEIVTAPAHGTLSGAAPNLTYSPAANRHGPDTLTFRVTDGFGQSDTATVAITVTPVNDAPIASGQAVTTEEDTARAIALSASDAEQDALTYDITVQPAHGTATANGANVVYTPAANYHGPDEFRFVARDASATSSPAIIRITVSPVNDLPVATPQPVSTSEDTPVAVTLTATDVDGDALTYDIVAEPVHGTQSGTKPNLTYTPAANYHGTDELTYVARDGSGASQPGRISITITPAADVPVAAPQSVTTPEDTAIGITLSASDADGDTLTYTVARQPTRGTLTGNAPSLLYAPEANFNGTDELEFVASDGALASAPVKVTITVTPVNDLPVAVAKTFATNEGQPHAIPVEATDADGDALTYAIETQPTHGRVSGASPNYIYAPEAGYAGADTLTYVARDASGASAPARVDITVVRTNRPPIANPGEVTLAEDATATLTLAASDPDGDSLTYDITRQPAHGELTGTGANRVYIPRANFHGSDEFAFVARDATTGSAPATIRITVTPVNDAPTVRELSLTTEVGVPRTFIFDGSDVDGDALTFAIATPPAHGAVAGTGATRQYTPTAGFAGVDRFTYTATDGFATSLAAPVDVTVVGTCGAAQDSDDDGLLDDACITAFTPPNPSTIAPPIDPTIFTDYTDATKFLYESPTPIQRGLAPGAIASHRQAVMRGKVMDQAGLPLPGVLVRVLDHPEYGYTYTRADGMFDIAVNGGGDVVVDFSKPGFLRAQRDAHTPWLDWRWVDDTVLVALDALATRIDFSSTQPQVAQGSPVTDDAGTRRATMIVSAGTAASLELPDGTMQAVSALTLRATEYTVGALGEKAMPASLPDYSGYTYAVELSADEAIARRARRVVFSQPVALYLDAFIPFPVGSEVPTGYYDYRYASWIPSANGRVVQVLRVVDGRAELDVRGAGVAATASELAQLGVRADELQAIASTYAPGKKLWRTPVAHLTPWDMNFPYTLDPDDVPPPAPEADTDDPTDENVNDDPTEPDVAEEERVEDPCTKVGSVIECENRVLGKSLTVAGTPFKLTYRSDRAIDASRSEILSTTRRIRTKVAGSVVPPRLLRAELTYVVLGQRIKFTLDPTPNAIHQFDWDGRDAYNRLGWRGAIPISTSLSYVYKGLYAPTPDLVWRGLGDFGRFGGVTFAPVLRPDQGRPEIFVTRSWFGEMQGRALLGTRNPQFWDARGLGFGGWSLSVHHLLDPRSRTLYLGDGTQRSVGRFESNTITALDRLPVLEYNPGPLAPGFLAPAADGSLYAVRGSAGEEGPAELTPVRLLPDGTEVPLTEEPITARAAGVAVDERGRSYYGLDDRIIRFAADGTREVVFDGTAASPTCKLERFELHQRRVYTVCADPAAGSAGLWVNQVWPNGSVQFLFGRGSRTDENAPVTDAAFPQINALAVAANGDVYVAEDYRVRRVRRDGWVVTVAGTGSPGDSDDGVAATQAALGRIHAIAVAEDETLYIGEDSRNGRVREVRKSGEIFTQAGGGGDAFDTFQAVPTRVSFGTPNALSVLADGSLFVGTASPSYGRIAASSFRFGTNPTDEIHVPSADAGEVFVFSSQGRHLRTINALTGGMLHGFEYDSAGRLLAIVDGFANRTSIERDGVGNAQAIVSPYGVRTTLSVNGNGYLASLTTAESEQWTIGYSAGGLLETSRDPRGHTSRYTWEGNKLATSVNAEGGGWTITQRRWNSLEARESTYRSALGRRMSVGVDRDKDRSRQRQVADVDGRSMTQFSLPNHEEVRFGGVGEVHIRRAPDPRFGLASSIPEIATLKLPISGAAVAVNFQRVAFPWSGSAPGQLNVVEEVSMVPAAPLASLSYMRNYEADTRRWTVTSPEGRTTTYDIDERGIPTRIAIPGLAPIVYAYDARGRVQSIVAAGGGERRATSFDYDARGFLSEIVDPEERVVSLTNDAVGRARILRLPDSREVSFTYDASGNTESIIPPGRPAHRFRYDRVDRLQRYEAPGVAGVAQPNASYGRNLDQELTSASFPDGRVVGFEYEASTGSALRTTTSPLGSYQFRTRDGRVERATSPDGIAVDLTYDGQRTLEARYSRGSELGRVEAGVDGYLRLGEITTYIGGQSTPVVKARYGYDRDGLLTSVQVDESLTFTRRSDNGLLESGAIGLTADHWTHNAFAEPTAYEFRASGAQVYAAGYARDRLGRITRKDETRGAARRFDYSYDRAGRLDIVRQDDAVIADYDYDTNGNRLRVVYHEARPRHCAESATFPVTVAGTYDAQDRMTAYGSCTFRYGANGDLEERNDSATSQITRYRYDVFGSLKRVELPDARVIEYETDSFHRRIAKRVDGVRTKQWIYFDRLRPAAELDGEGRLVAAFVYAERSNVPSLILRDGSVYRIVADHLGSPLLVVDTASGTVAQALSYDVFGNVLSDTNPGFQPFGFAGGIDDRDTGLVRFGARDYDPVSGRWTAKDPIGFAGGDTSLYRYADGDPVNRIDPTGRFSITFALQQIAWSMQVSAPFRNSENGLGSPGPEIRAFSGAGSVSASLVIAQFGQGSVFMTGAFAGSLAGAGGWEIGRALDEWYIGAYDVSLGQTAIDFYADLLYEHFGPELMHDPEYRERVFAALFCRGDI